MASRQEISVDELRLGMYVAELDRPWLDTKFPFQGFVIASQGDIERLRKTCKTVFIDLEKGAGSNADFERTRPPIPGVRGSVRYPERLPVERELGTAKVLFEECKRVMEKNVQALIAGGELDAEALKSSVHSLRDSIEL